MCATILDNVIYSGLDFSIHQTPYSIHFSPRKKYWKNSSNKTPLNSPSPNTSLLQETQVDNFRQELWHTRNEYVKLYAVEHEARFKLDKQYHGGIFPWKTGSIFSGSIEISQEIVIENQALCPIYKSSYAQTVLFFLHKKEFDL